MNKQPAIEFKNITKRFGKVVANKNVNLTAYRGEILSILGENGSGKTTLMNMISGIYFPDEGQIFIDGKEGTTGLRIIERFANRDDVELIQISEEKRKDPAEPIVVEVVITELTRKAFLHDPVAIIQGQALGYLNDMQGTV